MERLSRSPRIVDIYSHCGVSMRVEALPFELEEVVVPGSGYIKQVDLDAEGALHSRNEYTAEEKLDIAIAMAESLADLHGYEGGVM